MAVHQDFRVNTEKLQTGSWVEIYVVFGGSGYGLNFEWGDAGCYVLLYGDLSLQGRATLPTVLILVGLEGHVTLPQHLL
jgi:hypothetical protein